MQGNAMQLADAPAILLGAHPDPPPMRRGPWSDAEQTLFREAVDLHGWSRDSAIAQHVGSRTVGQVENFKKRKVTREMKDKMTNVFTPKDQSMEDAVEARILDRRNTIDTWFAREKDLSPKTTDADMAVFENTVATLREAVQRFEIGYNEWEHVENEDAENSVLSKIVYREVEYACDAFRRMNIERAQLAQCAETLSKVGMVLAECTHSLRAAKLLQATVVNWFR